MENTNGVEVTENQSNIEGSVEMNGQNSLESLQDSLSSQKILNKELLKEIESMRRRFAGTIKMMKDDLFHLIEEKNLLQLKEAQSEESAKRLMSQMMSEMEQLKKQNQANMADHQAMIQEQHRTIEELKAKLNAQRVQMEAKAPNEHDSPDRTQLSDSKDNVNHDIPIDGSKESKKEDSDLPTEANILEESVPKPTKKKKRNILYRAAHRVSKKVRQIVTFCYILYDFMFFLFVFTTERF